MRKVVFPLLLLWSGGLLLTAAEETQSPSSPAAKKPASSSSQKKVASKKSSSTSSTRRSSRRRSVSSWRRGQQQPTPERYREIQQALIDKGYLQGPAIGNWGPESVDALKRFQQEENLEPTGKLDALSLIRLGLGPKRDASARNEPVTVAPQKAEP